MIRDINEAPAGTPAREAAGEKASEGLPPVGTRMCMECGYGLPPGTAEHCGKPTDEAVRCPRPDCGGGWFWRLSDPCLAWTAAALAAERERREAVERERDEAEELMLRACALAANLATVVDEFDRDELQLLALEADSVQRATGAYLAAHPAATASAPTTATAGEPLKCSATNGVLTITVGAGVLDAICGEYVGDQLGEWRVTDPVVFAEELVATLRREAENGTTAVHLMLDKAIVEAIENGAEGVEFAGEGASESENARDDEREG